MGEAGSPSLLELATRAHSFFEIKLTGVEGLTNLERMPTSQPVIVATDHLSDITIETVISQVEHHRGRVLVADEAANLNESIKGKATQWIAGTRLYPISTRSESDHRKHRQSFHQYVLEDYEKMAQAMETKKLTGVIAAHRPVYGNDIQLPRNPGLGCVTLASLIHAPIVPTALVIKANEDEIVKNPLRSTVRFITGNRPNAHLVFGEPVTIDYLSRDELHLAADFQNNDKRARSGPLRNEQAQAYAKLKLQGDKVMFALAGLLPADKRGKWVSATPEASPPG